MLIHQTLDKLEAIGLTAMATALREQLEQPQYLELSFEDRVGLLVDRELSWARLVVRWRAVTRQHGSVSSFIG
jgi:hypothetical protein